MINKINNSGPSLIGFFRCWAINKDNLEAEADWRLAWAEISAGHFTLYGTKLAGSKSSYYTYDLQGRVVYNEYGQAWMRTMKAMVNCIPTQAKLQIATREKNSYEFCLLAREEIRWIRVFLIIELDFRPIMNP